MADRSLLQAARILTPDEDIQPGNVLIEDGVIVAVAAHVPAPPDAEVIDISDLTLAPGFVDVHVHGGGGFSVATHDPAEIASYARWAVSRGVTSFLATVCASNLEEALVFLRTGAQVGDGSGDGATLLGLNLEGPFVSQDCRGALPESWVMPPDPRSFDGLLQAANGQPRLITLAPETPRAGQVLKAALAKGVTVALGHTNAGYDTARQAFEAGASHLTHAFNAMRAFHHRDPGPVGAAISSRNVTVEVIADGVHLHPATVEMLIRACGADRIALVTDAVPPAGLPTGAFRVGDQEAQLQGDRVLLPDGTIAGSAATMDQVVRNIVQWGVASLASAARMASTVPAAVAACADRKGRVAPGYDADIVALDEQLQVAMTWVRGRIVYSRADGPAS